MSLHASSRGTAKRRKLVTSAVAFVSLGALAVGAAVLTTDKMSTSDADVELASTATCYDMVTISMGGRNDTPRDQTKMLTDANGNRLPAALASDFQSDWIDQMVGVPNGAVAEDSYAAVYIEYPANMASYDTAVTTGVTNTHTVMNAISSSCPDTRFAIVGYSEGADVTRRAAMEIGNGTAGVDASKVVGVVIMADAGRGDGENPFPGSDSGTNPDGFDTKYQNNASGPAGAGALPGTSGGFGALDGRVASFCAEGDLTCAMPENTSLLHLAANVGSQLNIDALEREQLTPATGADLAMVLGRIGFAAWNHIASQEDWLANDETLLEVLIKVSEPGYKPTAPTTKASADAKADTEIEAGTEEPLPAEKAVNLAYLPSKIAKEIIGVIGSNTNTVPVLMNDPYGQTLGPGSGHHFDYWRDADPNKGRPLTSAQYAAAWLTQLAKDAEAGKPIASKQVQDEARMAVLSETTAVSTSQAATTTTSVAPAAPYVATQPLPAAPGAIVPIDPAAPVVPAIPPVEGQLPVAVAPAPEGGAVPLDATVPTDATAATVVPTTSAVTTTTVVPTP